VRHCPGASARPGAGLTGVVHAHHTTPSRESPAGWRELDPQRLGYLALQRIGVSGGGSVWRSLQWPARHQGSASGTTPFFCSALALFKFGGLCEKARHSE
jgi:hypothetical protein